MTPLFRLTFLALLSLSIDIPCLAQQFYFPETTLLYPDSFAIYWRSKPIREAYQSYTLQVKCTSIFGDDVGTFEPSEDSIVLLPFTHEMSPEGQILIELIFFKSGKPLSQDDIPRILKVVPKSDTIQSLKEVIKTAPEFDNLQRLANAYEDQKCYLNAVHVYERMIYSFKYKGQLAFREFLSRHPDRKKRRSGAVHR